jgi:hypothetical protein
VTTTAGRCHRGFAIDIQWKSSGKNIPTYSEISLVLDPFHSFLKWKASTYVCSVTMLSNQLNDEGDQGDQMSL